jgi:chemotaxis protein methyltransferase CheR
VIDADCVSFLQWALPRLGMRWPGFRKVRRQVCKRVTRRIAALGLDGVAAYRALLMREPGEWAALDTMCRITISRFYRDRAVWQRLAGEVLPALARARAPGPVRAWSAGCASGEEPFTLAILWQLDKAARGDQTIEITATDADAGMIARAHEGCYPPGCLHDAPDGWIETAFEDRDGVLCLRSEFRAGVRFLQQDLREAAPAGRFDLVLCRNLAFTYFDAAGQARALGVLAEHLAPDGVLVVGRRERLPDARGFAPLPGCPEILMRDAAAAKLAAATAEAAP